jgi:hypothetical protein
LTDREREIVMLIRNGLTNATSHNACRCRCAPWKTTSTR